MHVLLKSIELLPVNLLQIVFAFVAALGALFIWHLKRFRALAVYFLFNAILMVFNLLEELQITRSFYQLTPAFTLAVGPLLYFFIRGAVNDKIVPATGIALHLLPMLMVLPFTWNVQGVIVAGSISQIVYLIASFHLLYRYHVASMAVRADADSLRLNWVIKGLLVYALVIINDVLRLNLQTTMSEPFKGSWYFATVAVIFSIVCYLLFKALRQPEFFDDMNAYEQSLAQAPQADEEEMAGKVFAGIEQTITKDELYKKPRLSVTDISVATGLNVKDISWAINQATQQNFCEFINGLRVKAVQQQILIAGASNASLLGMAFDAGFNSKSTFNATFKKVIGSTPSQFVRQNWPEKGAKS
jgi:AraC-like DNA-binding protein